MADEGDIGNGWAVPDDERAAGEVGVENAQKIVKPPLEKGEHGGVRR